MVLQISKKSLSLAFASNAKKKTAKKAAKNSLIIKTRYTAALNLLLKKEKKRFYAEYKPVLERETRSPKKDG